MLKNYVKIAFKVFLRRKFYTFVSLLGICFTLTVLMLLTAILDYQAAPYPPEVHADRTLQVSWVMLSKGQGSSKHFAGYEFVDRYIRQLKTPEKIAVWAENKPVISYQSGDKVVMSLKSVDAAYWQVLEFAFLEGRPFTVQEEAEGAPVAVINEATRKKLYGSGPALGQSLETMAQRYRVIGVVRDVPGYRYTAFAEVWAPLGHPVAGDPVSRLLGDLQVLLLARTSGDFPRIKEEFRTMLSQVDLSEVPQYEQISAVPETPFERLASAGAFDDPQSYRRENYEEASRLAQWRFRGMLAGSALLIMLLPALNLINLNLSRVLERAPEIGVRKAFGASSRTLVGQFIAENVLLTLVGGVLGFGFSVLVLDQWEWQRYAEFHLNYRLFLYGLIAILVFGVLSGAYPAWRMSRLHPARALRGGKR